MSLKTPKTPKTPKDTHFRSPIVSVLGHVDAGKTKLLDTLRYSTIIEPGNITQDIRTVFIPKEVIKSRINTSIDIPGLLMIDTPGHESFIAMRSQGARICDIAILVVDIFKGLQQQTIESIKLLQENKTPFILALNKIDEIYKWKSNSGISLRKSLKLQFKPTLSEFTRLKNRVIVEMAENLINGKLYYEIKDFKTWVPIIPISALTEEGFPELLLLLTQYTQKKMRKRITLKDKLEATILEINQDKGWGMTMDVILVNGTLKRGDQILLCGRDGPIVTSIKSIPYVSTRDYTIPSHLEDTRTSTYYHNKVSGACSIKIVCPSLEKAIPGSSLIKVIPERLEKDKIWVMKAYQNLETKIDKKNGGIYVVASNLGSLQALINTLSPYKISGFNIGSIRKSDVIKALATADKIILGFNVKILPKVKEEAAKLGVKIFTDQVIYQLIDTFTKYKNKIETKEKERIISQAVFPCVLQILPQYIFHAKDPITVGVKVLDGVLKLDTPIVILACSARSHSVRKENIDIGTVLSIRQNDKKVDSVEKGKEVSVSLSGNGYLYGRHFDEKDILVSKISRESLDVMKKYFLKDVKKHLVLLKRLKEMFQID